MENRHSARGFAPGPLAPALSSFIFRASILVFFLLIGCGAPNDPTPTRQIVPQAVADLSASQLGDGVLLTFTLPKKAVGGSTLDGPPSVEIYRGAAAGGGKPNAPALVYSIPAAMTNDYLIDGRMQFRVPLPAGDISNPSGQPLAYTVRTRASRKRSSAESNVAELRVFPPLPAPTLLRADITETGIVLTWTAPIPSTIQGAQFAGFRVYRAEITPAEAQAVGTDANFKLTKPLVVAGYTQGIELRDAQIEFGRTYYYTVRAVARYGTQEVESSDSRAVAIQANDVFPPAPPKNLVAIVVPAVGESAPHVELSWDISSETDLAGYNVYRSDGIEPTARGEKLNQELLLTPAFRDLTAAPGKRYTYRVTAVDRTGNESAPSETIRVEFPPRVP
jgi:hypothetical protein